MTDDPDVELTGDMIGPRGKAWHFQPDFMGDPIFVPMSQCDVIPLVGESEGRVTLMVRGWLAKREGWIGG